MRCDILVSTVHIEITPVDVDSVEELENTAGEFSRKGLDGADQSAFIQTVTQRRRRSIYSPKDEDEVIPRSHMDNSLTAATPDGGMTRKSSDESPRPSMQKEEHRSWFILSALTAATPDGMTRKSSYGFPIPSMQQEKEEQRE